MYIYIHAINNEVILLNCVTACQFQIIFQIIVCNYMYILNYEMKKRKESNNNLNYVYY